MLIPSICFKAAAILFQQTSCWFLGVLASNCKTWGIFKIFPLALDHFSGHWMRCFASIHLAFSWTGRTWKSYDGLSSFLPSRNPVCGTGQKRGREAGIVGGEEVAIKDIRSEEGNAGMHHEWLGRWHRPWFIWTESIQYPYELILEPNWLFQAIKLVRVFSFVTNW